MAWYDRSGPGQDVFISTRIRLARNICNYPLGNQLSAGKAKELMDKVASIFPTEEGFEITDMSTIPPIDRGVLAEKHYISPAFAKDKAPGLLIREEHKGLSIMVCEEDHIRIHCLSKGFSLAECKTGAFEAEEKIDQALPIAYSEKFGYLTHCPTTLGTGMRVSVMLFLPALTYAKQMHSLSAQLQKMGLVIRGMQGEGSESSGCLYQISNQVTLGISEEETIAKVSDIVKKIAEAERQLRKRADSLEEYRIADKAARALGIFERAKLLSTAEFFSLWTDLRLGLAYTELGDISYEKLDKMIFEVMPSEMMKCLTQDTASLPIDMRRDVARAIAVRKILSK